MLPIKLWCCKYNFTPLALTINKTISRKRMKYVILLVLSGSCKMNLCIGIGCAAPVTVHWPCARVGGACNADFFSKSFCYYYLFITSNISNDYCFILLWSLYKNKKSELEARRRGTECPCKRDWLWVWTPLEEIKFTFPFSLVWCSGKAWHWV